MKTIHASESVGYFAVMSEACNECLLGPNKIVDDSRRRELLSGCRERDDFFICHKATIAGYRIACRAHYDSTGGGQLGRIANRLGMIREISLRELESK